MRIIPDSEILFVTLLFLSPSMIWMNGDMRQRLAE